MIIVYSGNGEILICEENKEEKLIDEYFTNGGRDKQEYDRIKTDENCYFIRIESRDPDLRIE